MTVPTPSVREWLVEHIRETLDPLFPGGCHRFKQSGVDSSVELPCVILLCGPDRTTDLEAGGIAGGRRMKRMPCAIALRMVHNVDHADPDSVEWSDQAADPWLVIAEKAVAALNDDAEFIGRCTDLVTEIETFPPSASRRAGDAITTAGVTFVVKYSHLHLDPTVAA